MKDKMLDKMLNRLSVRLKAGNTVGAEELLEDISDYILAKEEKEEEVEKPEVEELEEEKEKVEPPIVGELPDEEPEEEDPKDEIPEPSHKFFRETKLNRKKKVK